MSEPICGRQGVVITSFTRSPRKVILRVSSQVVHTETSEGTSRRAGQNTSPLGAQMILARTSGMTGDERPAYRSCLEKDCDTPDGCPTDPK